MLKQKKKEKKVFKEKKWEYVKDIYKHEIKYIKSNRISI
jgi:hypothetical protein